MGDLIHRQDVIQECKAEFLNTNVQRQTERQTLIDQSFARGWNACNRQWMNEVLQLPPAQPEPLTDDEQRIFLAAMGREEELCRWLESECNGPCEVDLVRTCHEITRKVKGALWDGN